MNRFLQWFNVVGVCALAILCAVQWQVNRRLNLHRIDLESAAQQQEQLLAGKDKTIAGNVADMNDFRDRLARAEEALGAAQATIKADDGRVAQLSARCDALQETNKALAKSLEDWKAAVAARDAALKQAADQAQKLAADRNDAIVKFNELAGRYNAAQVQLKQAAEDIKKVVADRNDAVSKFNDLANRYNTLVKQVAATATRP